MFHVEQNEEHEKEQDTLKAIEIRRICSKNGTFLKDRSEALLKDYVRMLRGWNSKVNLVSRKDTDNLWEAHILHSLSILFEVSLPDGCSIIDLGTGGGLPGIPIKIVRPDISLTLLDATRKKTVVVEEIVENLEMEEVSVVWGRAEDPAIAARLSGQFDVVVTRAVAPLPQLIRWSYPMVRKERRGGQNTPHLIALKGGALEAELASVRELSHVKKVRSKDLTFSGAENIPGVEKKIVTVHF